MRLLLTRPEHMFFCVALELIVRRSGSELYVICLYGIAQGAVIKRGLREQPLGVCRGYGHPVARRICKCSLSIWAGHFRQAHQPIERL